MSRKIRIKIFLMLFVVFLIMVSSKGTTSDPSRKIEIKLEYKNGSVWDSDDDGIETDRSAIDFTVENTRFNWNVDYSKLCTKWDIESIDGKETRSLCYGSTKCCGLVGLNSTGNKWNDSLYLQYGRDVFSRNNRVSARVIYVDYMLDIENPYSYIYYSDVDYLYAVYLDNSYFNSILAQDKTSDRKYMAVLSSFENIRGGGVIDKIVLSDINGNKVFGLNNKRLNLSFYINKTNSPLSISIINFTGKIARWENLERISVRLDDIADIVSNHNVIVRKAVTIKNIDKFLSGGYKGIVNFYVRGVLYSGVMHCDGVCKVMRECEGQDTDCYRRVGDNIIVFVPHFSSVILFLNSSAINLTIISPDNSTELTNGEDLYLNFTTNLTVRAKYMLDDGEQIDLGNNKTFFSVINGSLEFGVVDNGRHILLISLMDNSSGIANYSYSFIVNDTYAPVIDVTVDNSPLNNSLLNSSEIEVNISSSEYGKLMYRLNNGTSRTRSFDINRIVLINLSLNEGMNSLEINVSDMHNNSNLLFYYFNLTPRPSCADGIKNGDETDIDCGGSCGACIPFTVTLNKDVFELGEDVIVNILSRINSSVDLVVVNNGNVVYSEHITSYSPDYPIYVTKTIDNINEAGDYMVNATMDYKGHRETKILYFYVNAAPGNPLSVTIVPNKTTANEGEVIGFRAVVTGNTSSVSYNWDFGDGFTSTEETPTHTYYSNGSYTVNLTVLWDGWIKFATTKITVKKLINVSIIVKNESGSPLSDAYVGIENEEKVTGADGVVSFLINPGVYDIGVYREGYEVFSNVTRIYRNMTVEVRLRKKDDNNEAPVIVLSGPDDNIMIDDSNFTLYYKVMDSSNVNCTLYISFEGGWWIEKASQHGVEPDKENTLVVDNLDNGVYQWKIECIDDSGNSGTSEIRNIRVNKSEIKDEDDTIENAVSIIDEALSNLEYLGKNENDAASSLQLKKTLERARRDLRWAQRDLHNLIWRRLNKTEKEEVKASILERVEDIKRRTPKAVRVIDSKDFVSYPSREDVDNMSLLFLESKGRRYKKKEREAYSKYNQRLQGSISIMTKWMVVDVEYLSGDKGTVTLLNKVIKAKGNLTDTSIIESIPKRIASNTSRINALFKFDVVVEDPVIRIPMPLEEYSYYFNGRIELNDIKNIKSVLVYNDVVDVNPVVGFAVFGGVYSKIVESGSLRLVIEIFVIVILLIIYLNFSGAFTKVKYLIKDRKVMEEIREIDKKIDEAFEQLQTNQYEKAKSSYVDISQRFKKLPKELKEEVYGKISELTNRLDALYINKLIDRAVYSLESGQKKEALLIYNKISNIYKKISPRFKGAVLERCNELYKKIQAAKD